MAVAQARHEGGWRGYTARVCPGRAFCRGSSIYERQAFRYRNVSVSSLRARFSWVIVMKCRSASRAENCLKPPSRPIDGEKANGEAGDGICRRLLLSVTTAANMPRAAQWPRSRVGIETTCAMDIAALLLMRPIVSILKLIFAPSRRCIRRR